jgi:hypothetical protein
MTLSGIEIATFRLVAQCLNQALQSSLAIMFFFVALLSIVFIQYYCRLEAFTRWQANILIKNSLSLLKLNSQYGESQFLSPITGNFNLIQNTTTSNR